MNETEKAPRHANIRHTPIYKPIDVECREMQDAWVMMTGHVKFFIALTELQCEAKMDLID